MEPLFSVIPAVLFVIPAKAEIQTGGLTVPRLRVSDGNG